MLLSIIGLCVSTLYCLGNTIMILGRGPRFSGVALDIYSAFSDAVLTVDLCSWHVYGVFAIFMFIYNIVFIVKNKADNKCAFTINTVLHLILSVVSFFEIYWIFENSF